MTVVRVEGIILRKSKGTYNATSKQSTGSIDVQVEKTVDEKVTTVTVYTINYGPEHEGFWPHIALYDSIVCKLKVTKDKQDPKKPRGKLLEDKTVRLTATIKGLPFITRAQNVKDITINAMIRACRVKDDAKGKKDSPSGNKLSMSVKQIVILYYYILEHKVGTSHPDSSLTDPDRLYINVEEYLTHKAYLYHIGDRTNFITDLLEDYQGTLAFSNSEVDILLKRWYQTNDIRLLKLLGITFSIPKGLHEFEACFMSPGRLYSSLLQHPMYVHCLKDYDKAKALCKMMRIKVTDLDKRCCNALLKLSARTARNNCVYVNSMEFLQNNRIGGDVYERLQELGIVKVVMAEDDSSSRMYLRELYYMEESVARCLARILVSSVPLKYDPELLTLPDPNSNIIPDQEQREAVATALKTGITIITGPAGTGKTTTIQKAIQIFLSLKIELVCTAFTGKATARIEECCKIPTRNMDTMIIQRESYSHIRNMVIDEISMVSLPLIYKFLNAFPNLERLILVGDPKQIEPIGYGNIMGELMKSNTIPVCCLKTIHRVKTKSGVEDKIIKNSTLISQWKGGENLYKFHEGDNFVLREGSIKAIKDEILKMKKQGITPDKFVVISPYNDLNKNNMKMISHVNDYVQFIYHGGNKCVGRLKKLNSEGVNSTSTFERKWEVMKSFADKKGSDVTLKKRVEWLHKTKKYDMFYCVGDLVMCITNNHQLVTYNGQEGIIKNVSKEGITVLFKNGNEVIFSLGRGERTVEEEHVDGSKASFGDVNDIILAYAVTVHKMQGGQREIVIYYLEIGSFFVTRSITYTAITRASEKVIFIGNIEILCDTISNINTKRKDSLHLQLRNFLPQNFFVKEGNEMERELAARNLARNLAAEAECGGAASVDYSMGDNGSCQSAGSNSGSLQDSGEDTEVEIVAGSDDDFSY